MRFVLVLMLVVLALPSGLGQEKRLPPPVVVESFLPADSWFYFRYDGYEPHRTAYDRTALGRAMKDDLGEFLEFLALQVTELATSSLKEKNPQELQKLEGNWKQFMSSLWRHGVAVAGQIRNLPGGLGSFPYLNLTAGLRLTLVFPEAGTVKNRELFLTFLNLLADDNNPVKKRQLGKRIVHEWGDKEFRVACWNEGRHLIMILGQETVEGALEVVEGRRPSLNGSPLWKGLVGFKDYETDIRGFVDVQKFVDLMRTPPANESRLAYWKDFISRGLILSQLGLTSMKSLTFHLGFDRQYQRSTIVLNVVEPKDRSGLMKLAFAPVQFEPGKLPPLPPDAASVRVSKVDWQVFHDVVRQIALLAFLGNFTSAIDLGVNFPKEILAHLDSTLVLYNSHSEGMFFLGQGIAVKVKDELHLQEGLQKLVESISKAVGGGIEIKKRTYRGVDLTMISLPFLIPLAPTFTIHKGWLVLSPFPQAVKGYILRSEGKHKVWQAPALVAETLALAKKRAGPQSKLAAVTVTDPRPTTTLGLSLMPVIVRALGSAGISLDDSKIPNAQAITEWQFPGVTIFYDDGHALRWESQTSFEAPADWLLLGIAYFSFAGL